MGYLNSTEEGRDNPYYSRLNLYHHFAIFKIWRASSLSW